MKTPGKRRKKHRKTTRKPCGERPETQLGPAEEYVRQGIIAMRDAVSPLTVEAILSLAKDLSRLPEHQQRICFAYSLALASLTLRASNSKRNGYVQNTEIRFQVRVEGVKCLLPIICAIPLNQVPGLEVTSGVERWILGLVETWFVQQCERIAIERHPAIVPVRCDDEVEYDSWKGEPAPDSIPVELAPNSDVIDSFIEKASTRIDYWRALGKAEKLLRLSSLSLCPRLKRRLEGAIDPANRPSGHTQLKTVPIGPRNFGIVEALEKLEQQGKSIWGPGREPGPACEVVGTKLSMSRYTILDIYNKDKELQL